MSNPGEPLVDRDWDGAAWMLDCDTAAVKAVAEVEAPRGGYLSDGQVVILFERHIFHRFTKGKWDKTAPEISSPKPGGYVGGSREHFRLRAAVELDRDSALKSASWGRFQVMGFNAQRCGYASLQDFINGMIAGGEDEHLRAFVAYVRSDARLSQALRSHDWHPFARLYNGPDYQRNQYAERLAAAHEKHSQPRSA